MMRDLSFATGRTLGVGVAFVALAEGIGTLHRQTRERVRGR